MHLLNSTQVFVVGLKKVRNFGKAFKKFQHTLVKRSDVLDSGRNSQVIPVFRYANEYSEKSALHDVHGDFTYRSIFNASLQLSKEISRLLGHKPQERVAFLCPNDARYVITQWAAWMAGQIVVPLSKSHPPNLLEYYITDSNASLLITTPELSERISSLSVAAKSKVLVFDDSLLADALVQKEAKYVEKTDSDIVEASFSQSPETMATLDAGFEPEFYQTNDAMMIYTSGTTGPPKGVVLSHQNIHAQVQGMASAWGWSSRDTILHVLPLHHIHGVTNALITPLSVGAKVVMMPEWNVGEVWTHLLAIKKQPTDRANIFMGVPTMYSKLIEEYDNLFAANKRQVDFIRSVLSQKVRLMVSGSAPLPEPLLKRWHEVSGHVLLERYGMTETGMVLSNPLEGERRPGSVGTPLPGVQVRIVSKDQPDQVLASSDDEGHTKVESSDGKPITGDLQVKGQSVFKCYYNKPNATAKEFTNDGWFKTGDSVEYVDGYYRILGRTSVDIIKTGGFKVSALDIETALLGHEDIQDVACVGIPDLTWGEKVAAIVVLKKDKKLELNQIREWSKSKLAPYAIPTELKIVEAIPRNQMGKINKKELLKTLFTVK